jgi:hypothetical protein
MPCVAGIVADMEMVVVHGLHGVSAVDESEMITTMLSRILMGQ